jgi:hypothetical protein
MESRLASKQESTLVRKAISARQIRVQEHMLIPGLEISCGAVCGFCWKLFERGGK